MLNVQVQKTFWVFKVWSVCLLHSKYYEKDALVADSDYGSILSSLLGKYNFLFINYFGAGLVCKLVSFECLFKLDEARFKKIVLDS